MTTLPLGYGAYKRSYGAAPEIKLLNYFVEKSPTNLKEHVSLLTRPGTKPLAYFPPDSPSGRFRGFFSKLGNFNSDLFTTSGTNFYRYDGTTIIPITGVVQGTEAPRVTWMKGIGYEFLFIADGQKLQFYDGGSHATGVLTSDGTANHAAVIDIGGVYYSWAGSLTDPASDGTVTHPWVVKPGASVADDLTNLAATINFDGVPGTDFSSTLGGPNVQVSALAAPTTVTVTYVDNTVAGNSVATSVSGSHLSWGHATLTGGAVHILQQVAVPEAQPIESVATLNGYVIASVALTQKAYFIEPGETTIDALNFFEKESAPDPIIDMAALGDVLIIAGAGSTEFWNATGDNDEPFAPIEGRAFSRGIVPGTMVVVNEGDYICVGNDGRVYSVGSSPVPISDHGIEERIRVQLWREGGLT